MATYEEYISRWIDPGTARAWSVADAYDEDEYYLPAATQGALPADSREPVLAVEFGPGSRDLDWVFLPAPREVSGYDSTRTVGVQVDRQHMPHRLVLRDDWDQTLRAEALEAAIFTAYRAGLTIQYEQMRTDPDYQDRAGGGPSMSIDVTDGFLGSVATSRRT